VASGVGVRSILAYDGGLSPWSSTMSVAEKQVVIAAAKAAHAKKNAGTTAPAARGRAELMTALFVAVVMIGFIAIALWRR
jgi:hypothetical protein